MALADNPYAETLISSVHVYNLDRGSGQKYLRLDCPWCGDSKGHLHFYLDNSVSRCMRCGAWGKIGYLFRALGLPVPEHSALAEDYSGTFKEISARLNSGGFSHSNGYAHGQAPEIDLPEGTISFQFLDPHFQAHARVLFKVTKLWRISHETARALKWQWNAELDSFIFPVFETGEEMERLVYWSARSFDGKFRTNAPAPADLSAYGHLGHFNHPLRKTAQEVYVVEGPRDAAALLQENFWGVYLLGHNPGQRQIERLQSLSQTKVLLLDADVTEHAASLAERLGWTILYLPQGDPGDCAGQAKTILAQAWQASTSPLDRRLSHIRQKLFTTQIHHH